MRLHYTKLPLPIIFIITLSLSEWCEKIHSLWLWCIMFSKIITENSQEIIIKFVLFVFKHQRRLCNGTKIYHRWPIVIEFVCCHKMFWIMIYFRNRTWKTNLKVLIKWLNNNGSGQRVVVVFYLYAHEMCNWCRFYYFLLLRVEVDQCCKCCWQTIVSYSLKKSVLFHQPNLN